MIIWIIGLSGAGKTTVSRELVSIFRNQQHKVLFLDGDKLRSLWEEDLEFNAAGRRKNHLRFSNLCKMLDQESELIIIVAALSIFPDLQEWNRQNFERYFEVFLDTPIDIIKSRDSKGLYKKVRNGIISDVVGIDIPFPRPVNPDLIIKKPEIFADPGEIAELIYSQIVSTPRKSSP